MKSVAELIIALLGAAGAGLGGILLERYRRAKALQDSHDERRQEISATEILTNERLALELRKRERELEALIDKMREQHDAEIEQRVEQRNEIRIRDVQIIDLEEEARVLRADLERERRKCFECQQEWADFKQAMKKQGWKEPEA